MPHLDRAERKLVQLKRITEGGLGVTRWVSFLIFRPKKQQQILAPFKLHFEGFKRHLKQLNF